MRGDDMGLTLLGRLVQFAVMILSVRIMTTLLEPTQYAHYAVLTALSAFFVFCAINPICAFVHREINRWFQHGIVLRSMGFTAAYVLGVACLTALILEGYGSVLNAPALQSDWAAWVVGLNVFSASLSHIGIVGLNVLGHARAFAWLTMGMAVVCLLSAAWLATLSHGSALAWLLGLALGQCALTLCCVLYAYKIGVLKSRRASAKMTHTTPMHPLNGLSTAWAFAMPVALSTLFVWLQSYGHRLVLEHTITTQQLGLFAAGYGLAVQSMLAIELILNTWFLPRFYQNADIPAQGQHTAWLQYAKSMWFPSVVGVAVVYSAAHVLGKTLLAPQYHSAVQYVQMGVVVEWLRIQVGVLSLYFHQHKRTQALIWPVAFGALLAMGLIVWRVPTDGVDITLGSLALGAMCMALGLLLRIAPAHRPNLWQFLMAGIWLALCMASVIWVALPTQWALWPVAEWLGLWAVLGGWSLALATQKPSEDE